MKLLVNAEEMRRCDNATIEYFGVPSLVLMERAALAVVEALLEGEFCTDRVLVVCGSGNNGGDGFAVARILTERHISADVWFVGKEESLSESARTEKNICEKYGVNIGRNLIPNEYTCIVDSIFGVGLSRDIKEPYAGVIRQINESTRPVLAVDMPSGISADTGQVLGVAVRAAKTVTFAFAKTGQILYPGADYCGEVLVRHVGITERGFGDERPKRFYLESADLSKLPPRHPYSNKGTYGKALLVAGQRHMAGAACLAGEAAYRMGCGLVKICTESCNREIMQTRLVEALFSPYDEQPLSLEWPSAIGIGPGLGTDDEKWEILKKTLTETVCPVVVDADGLNLLAGRKEVLKEHKGTVLVTPHIGEMMRLTGETKEALLRNLPEACRSFAEAYGVICILKDTRTVISDGKNICINRTGCDGMATGGSGDVLTGMITGLLASGMDGFEAACLAVWIHGKAGEEAAGRLGRRGMLAGDLLDEIPKIMQKAERGEKL